MGGGLLQLVAYGAQDVYLTGNPQITFFMVVYRRHTNFAIEAIEQTFNGTAAFGNSVTVTVSRNGDLINRAYMQVRVPSLTNYKFGDSATDRYVNYFGLRLLQSVTVEIGGQQIDKHYSDWLYIWNELSLPLGKRTGWEMMVGADGDVLSGNNSLISKTASVNGGASTLYIPLEFWFCRNVGLSLPLIALQYHEVKFKIQFEEIEKCIAKPNNSGTLSSDTTGTNFTNKVIDAKLWIDYIFLDTDERRRFAQNSQEYLIEQLQFTGTETLSASSANKYRLNFNHPCKELVWVARNTSKGNNYRGNSHDWYNYTYSTDYMRSTSNYYISPFSGVASSNLTSNIVSEVYPMGVNPFKTCLLQLNGNDRFAQREGVYFNYVQPYQHHTNIPVNKGINVYSFALKPEEHQPSGTLNMSRIDTAVLSLEPNTNFGGEVNIYAVNYNVLRIMSGMGGLAYSN
jgi:hypothetical protein